MFTLCKRVRSRVKEERGNRGLLIPEKEGSVCQSANTHKSESTSRPLAGRSSDLSTLHLLHSSDGKRGRDGDQDGRTEQDGDRTGSKSSSAVSSEQFVTLN
ncbi:hypothetical protein Q7C36_011212 [Tachysurus vachellii]|uniref:Uncharacterized protein n=1 Tax=Tachysurus vachellii TaxID=175792 RepID=A0AA88MTT7_TACVA|nr:hypothetical protein Q7C36_011212 [Tachysurus vachellii]